VEVGMVVADAGRMFRRCAKTGFAVLRFEHVRSSVLPRRSNICDVRTQSEDSRFQGVTSHFLAKC
jgi:hypothetical protein